MLRIASGFARIASASLLMAVGGCASSPVQTAPCFDGWSTGASGSSKLWIPDPGQAAKLRAIDPRGEPVACYHVMPSGEVIVLTLGEGDIHAYHAAPNADGYILGSTGTIVSAR